MNAIQYLRPLVVTAALLLPAAGAFAQAQPRPQGIRAEALPGRQGRDLAADAAGTGRQNAATWRRSGPRIS